MTAVTGDFHGHPTRVVHGPALSVELLADAGPRIASLSLAGSGVNLLGHSAAGWDTSHGYYEILGGHRLWVSPETLPTAHAPDTKPVRIDERGDGVRVVGAPDPAGLVKSMDIAWIGDEPSLLLTHEIANTGDEPVECAAWGITVVPHGGLAITATRDPAADLGSPHRPDRLLSLWCYTNINDPRLTLGQHFISLRHTGSTTAKIGTFSPLGVIGCLRDGVLLRKVSRVDPTATFPDHGMNIEMYITEGFAEIETLGPLAVLEPGQTRRFVERWDVLDTPASHALDPNHPAGVAAALLDGLTPPAE